MAGWSEEGEADQQVSPKLEAALENMEWALRQLRQRKEGVAARGTTENATHVEEAIMAPSPEAGPGLIDWRTLDPSAIQGDGVPVEELRFYQQNLESLLRAAEGRYVLIVGREVIAFFDDIEAAAGHAEEHYPDKAVLIKRVAASQPIPSLGGASAGEMVASGGMRD